MKENRKKVEKGGSKIKGPGSSTSQMRDESILMSRGDFLKGVSVAAAGFVATSVGLGGVAKAQAVETPPCEKVPPDYMNCPDFGPAYVFSTLAAAVDTLFPGPEGMPVLVVDQNFHLVPADPANPNPMMNLGASGIDTSGAAGFISQTAFPDYTPLPPDQDPLFAPGYIPPAYPILFRAFPSRSQMKNIIDSLIYALDQMVLLLNNVLVVPQLVEILVPMILQSMGCPPDCPPEVIEQATQQATQMAQGLVLCKDCSDPNNPVLYAFKDLPYDDTMILLPPFPPFNGQPSSVQRIGRYTIMDHMDRPELLRELPVYPNPYYITEDTVIKAQKIFEAFHFFTAMVYYSEHCNIIPSGLYPNRMPIFERNQDCGFDIYPGSAWDQMGDVEGEDLGPYYPNSFDCNYMPEAKPTYEGLVVKISNKIMLKWVK